MKKYLAFLALFTFLSCRSFSQELSAIPVDIINAVITEDTCFIYYNLEGKPDTKYKITLYLRQGKDNPVSIELKNVSGKVGIGYHAGKGNKITWNLKRESLKGINENLDVQFEIKAEVIPSENEKVEIASGSNTIYWIGGGALAAGVITYFLLNNKTTDAEFLPDPSGFNFPK